MFSGSSAYLLPSVNLAASLRKAHSSFITHVFGDGTFSAASARECSRSPGTSWSRPEPYTGAVGGGVQHYRSLLWKARLVAHPSRSPYTVKSFGAETPLLSSSSLGACSSDTASTLIGWESFTVNFPSDPAEKEGRQAKKKTQAKETLSFKENLL